MTLDQRHLSAHFPAFATHLVDTTTQFVVKNILNPTTDLVDASVQFVTHLVDMATQPVVKNRRQEHP